MIRVILENRNTKVKSVLECYMNLPTGDEIKLARFHSCLEVNLDGTDEKEFYDAMVDVIFENMASFMALGSGWRLYSIIQ